MNKIFVWTGLCLALASCKHHHPVGENTTIRYKGDTIVVPENSPVAEHLIARKFYPEDFSAEFKTVGTVRPVSGKLAEIASPFAGRILRSFVRLGQKINAGEPVFELGSTEFYQATKDYFAAESSENLARRNYNRLKELAAHGVASQKDLEQAESEAEIAGKEFEQAKATLQLFNTDASSVWMGEPLRVVSPIPGEVVKYHIILGSYAGEQTEALAVVADLSQVWVAALVKEKYFGSIRHGDRVEVFTDAHPEKVIWGTIYYIGQMLDEETRSLEVIVACDNAARDLKLGMFCEVHFQSAPSKAILVPSTAIMQEQEHDFVLVEVSRGCYVRRKVESETAGANQTRILSGVDAGESVVIKGGIFLNK
ncbi:MAG: efflux RND transporter periplasmic adaptor subunit [Tannerellaceae bacterium]|jgi:cobalt-zinc-cadmium efflux system membrane fusion protein|nr:efflux RND transporter periplasmic adaptor subunit [Tannerellaceae bacterium]